MREKFWSKGGIYGVVCPAGRVAETKDYVNFVEGLVAGLREVFFPLKPSFDRYTVIFGDEGTFYVPGGTIHVKDKDLGSEKKRYGGLFHETVHGFVEKYIHKPDGENVHPREALVITLQVEALYKVNEDSWARKFENGCGSKLDVHCWLNELGRIRRKAGIEPIRLIYKAMDESVNPVFTDKKKYTEEVNRLWKQHGLSCRLKLCYPDGLNPRECGQKTAHH